MIENDIKLLEQKRDKLNSELDGIKDKVNTLKKPENL